MNENCYSKEQELKYHIGDIIKDIENNESKILLKIGFYKWINRYVGMLSHEGILEEVSNTIAVVYYNLENNGFKDQESAYLKKKKIITNLIKASGSSKQRDGFRMTIDKIILKVGKEKLLESIRSNDLIAYKGIYKRVPKKYKLLKKTIEKLERKS